MEEIIKQVKKQGVLEDVNPFQSTLFAPCQHFMSLFGFLKNMQIKTYLVFIKLSDICRASVFLLKKLKNCWAIPKPKTELKASLLIPKACKQTGAFQECLGEHTNPGGADTGQMSFISYAVGEKSVFPRNLPVGCDTQRLKHTHRVH